MEAWVLALFLNQTPYGRLTTIHNIDIQSEDACVSAAKQLTSVIFPSAFCVNTFDGRVLYFTRGKQVATP